MKKSILFVGVLLLSGTELSAQTYTFTTAGVTGNLGPTQVDVNAAYTGTTLDAQVIINTQGIQEWIVPVTGTYSIQALGAEGGNSTWTGTVPGGLGSTMMGEFSLTAGQVISVLVGQEGEDDAIGGGGGGSYVVLLGSPLVVAGGGGGASSDQGGVASVITGNGTMDSQGLFAGGTAGSGGAACIGSDNNGGGGGGFSGDGVTPNTGGSNNNGFGGLSFLNGGTGGIPGRMDGACTSDPYGGFGGGGSGTCNTVGGGGGGGYSGGAGGPHIGNCGASVRSGGGGGGSINNGANQANTPGNNSGPGMVIITNLCTPSTITPILPALVADSNECSAAMPIPPIATTNCGDTIFGTTTTVFPITTFGTTNITWTFNAGGGITNSQTQDIVVTDLTAPVPDSTSLLDVTSVCSVDSLSSPSATDSCSGVVLVSNNVTFPITAQGTTVVTWTFDDGNGNTSTQTQNVILSDTLLPIADSMALPDVDACLSADPVAPTATDNCAGTVTATPDVTLPITTAGMTIITWTFDDGNGNTSTQTQNVSVTLVETGVTTTGFTLNSDASGATYQWIDCDNGNTPIAGETNQSFTASVTGNYAVVVIESGCTDTSDCMLVDYSSLQENDLTLVNIYPNPSKDGIFTVTSSAMITKIDVLDVLGRSMNVESDLSSGMVKANTLPNGRYLVRLSTEGNVYIRDLIILK